MAARCKKNKRRLPNKEVNFSRLLLLSYLRLAPRKVRLVTSAISNMAVDQAESQLKFLGKRAAKPVLKLLRSAAANAKNNYGLEKKDLVIKKSLVNEGPTLKRWMPRAMGRATPIMKRTSHIEIGLEAKPGVTVKKITPETEEKQVKKKEQVDNLQAEQEEAEQKQAAPLKEEGYDKQMSKVKPERPYPTTPEAKKRFFSRQPFNQAKKDFKRKTG